MRGLGKHPVKSYDNRVLQNIQRSNDFFYPTSVDFMLKENYYPFLVSASRRNQIDHTRPTPTCIQNSFSIATLGKRNNFPDNVIKIFNF